MTVALERDESGIPRARLLPDRHGLVVRLQAEPGGRPALLDALHRYIDRLGDEPATEFFCISLDPDEPEVVWLHEWFQGEDGIAAHWNASAYGSLLELAEACDVPVRWSCRTGVCHNCESGLVAGEVAYEPEPLDRPADGNVLVCCSRPIRDVVIDL